jgi:regulator of protease activity HflC (stomatin/prohibitin superfamily)
MSAPNFWAEEEMSQQKLVGTGILIAILIAVLLPSVVVAQNQLLGEVEILGKTKIDKTSGVWVDGQYLGYVEELTGDKKI